MSNFIMQYAEAEKAEEMSRAIAGNAWKELRAFAGRAKGDPDKFSKQLQSKEDEFMEEMFGKIKEAKWENGPKEGQWKYRKFSYTDGDGNKTVGGLPPAYMSAKSTLVQAMKNEVTFRGLGKTAVADRIAAAKRVTLTSFQKARRDCEHLVQLWPALTAEERDALQTEFLGTL